MYILPRDIFVLEVKNMKYKCLKCETEFEITYEAICPNCKASGFDVESLWKWQRAQAAVVAGET